MKPLYKGLAVALAHILIVLSLGGKLLYDRSHRPRIWVRTGSVDPDLPIRGRYLTLNLEVHVPEYKSMERTIPNLGPLYDFGDVTLAVENGELVAHKSGRSTGIYIHSWNQRAARTNDVFLLSSPVVFFIPEHAEGPSRTRGDELWAEVTVPRKGPPRPIQLALKHGQEWRPLTYR